MSYPDNPAVIYVRFYHLFSVFRAVNLVEDLTAACKLVIISPSTTEKDRKTMEREMRIHSVLKHANILKFMDAVVVELMHCHTYVPGIYMLLEFAGGGDLFDKIGKDCKTIADFARTH